MRKDQYYQYFVEGEDERKLVNVLKSDLKIIIPGKVQIFNVTQQKLTRLRIMNLRKGTKVVLIFDTDAGNISILKKNITFLEHESIISEIICITQVRNLEDELIRSCSIKQIKDLLGSKSNKDFKHDMIEEKNLGNQLEKCKFNFGLFWNTRDKDEYKEIENTAYKIKIY
ncbi:MAG: hypothetical protein HFH53_06070 [Hespellia sp.]|nr:hypothetical protein [Hespellia sp.]